MNLDILAFGAHPDDVELSCAGMLIKEVKNGRKVGIVDLTEGELGTRGTPEIRRHEANEAAKIIGVIIRDNLGMEDGFFKDDDSSRNIIIKKIRQYQPDIVVANAPYDRHPDHSRASKMVSEACYYSGLAKIETEYEGVKQEPHRPRAVFFYMQHFSYSPSVLVDISSEMDQKLQAIRAFRSQFYDPASKEPETVLTSPRFIEHIRERCSYWGYLINTDYAEGFITQKAPIGINSIYDIKI